MSAEGDGSPPATAPQGEGAAVESRLLQAAEAIADGGWPGTAASDALPSLLPELDIIARVAQVHRDAARAHDDALGEESSDSLGDVLSRSIAPAPSRPDLTQARRWGPLFVLERVGGGSFGEVYRAWDPALDREVALKLLRLPSASQDRATAFVREGQLLASVHHPNVINVHGAAQIDGEVGIWMEFVRGRTLERIVLEDGPMSAQEASVIAESLCGALAAVHQQGLLHRDIKAANVMRASGGRIVLLDFGTGTKAASGASGADRLAGTPLYMAPEVLEGGAATIQSDIYSLGVLLFFLVTGAFPVYGKSLAQVRAAHLAGRRLLLADVRQDIPTQFSRIVQWALASERTGRPRSCGEVAAVFASEQDDTLEARRWAGYVAAGVAFATLGVWTLGVCTSMAFNTTLGRTGAFAREPISTYWIWGTRALVAPAFSMALAGALVGGGRTFVRLVGTAWPLGATLSRWRAGRDAQRAPLSARATGEFLILLQLLLLAVLVWRFQSIFGAVTQRLATARPDVFWAFQPENLSERNLFSVAFALGLFFSIVSCVRVERLHRHGASSIVTSTRVAAFSIAGLFLLLLVLPYRIGWQNEVERVQFDSRRCYAIGSSVNELLLYCPTGVPPKVRPVASDDPRLRRENIVESIFTP